MEKKTLLVLIFLLISACITTEASAAKLSIEILPTIKGTTYFVNYSEIINHTPQKIWTYWEDKGSVGCTNRLRIDIYNETTEKLKKTNTGFIDPLNTTNQNKLIYTAWSKPIPFHPGANDNLITYWYPYNLSGNFTAQFRLYSCNEIYEKPPFTFEVINWTKFPDAAESQALFEKISIKNKDENRIEITLKPKKDTDNLLILPQKYPRGWLFEHAKIDKLKKGKEHVINLNYIPGIWYPTNVTFSFVTEDGAHYIKKDFRIEKVESVDWLSLITTICIILTILGFFLIASKRHTFKTNSGKKTTSTKT